MTGLADRPTSVLAIEMTRWDAFYADWVKPIAQLVLPGAIALLVLVALSALLTRYLVPCESEAWGQTGRRAWTAVGGFSLLAVAVFLPLQPMYQVVGDGPWLTWAFPLVLVLPGVLLAVLAKRWPPGRWPHRPGPGISALTFWTLLLLWAVLTSCFFSWGERERLIVADIALALLGLTATATALGQSRRLQVEAQGPDGKSDVAASEYVMARLQSLGSRQPASLGIARPTELSRLASEDLKAVPGGAIATAAARIMYVLRPGLTWRALVTLVDADRVTVTLTRNSHQADCVLISGPALGLAPPGPAPVVKVPDGGGPAAGAEDGGEPAAAAEDGGRARAQLLTGAAACILVRLSRIHRELRPGLCGAEQWQSVALHVIAMEPTLTDTAQKRVELLRRAVKVEPEYGLARVDYLSERFQHVPGTAANRLRFAKLMDGQLALARPHGQPVHRGWEVIYLRTLYSSAAMRVNCYLTELAASGPRVAALRQAEPEILTTALDSVWMLLTQSRLIARRADDRQARSFAADMKPVAANLMTSIRLLREHLSRTDEGEPWRWTAPEPGSFPSPDLAYDYACLAALVKEVGLPPGSLGDLEDHLALAVATAADRRELWGDPSFAALLRGEAYGREIACAVGLPEQPVDMLDLAPFEPYAEKFRAIGVTTFERFRQVVPGAAEQLELTAHLGCSPMVTAHLVEVVDLAALHGDLSRPEVVRVFLDAGITGRAELLRRKEADQERLLATLSHGADRSGLAGQPAFARPPAWLAAL
ncbi:hypothetical protein ACFVVX_24565 [Kitasatospora sp. NPDC058170]|uniref:hypothetical protein n=1 Tax=Kitasatospora sp. NPDC058170 TaxID=3346364 RepID=UPI0036DD55E7